MAKSENYLDLPLEEVLGDRFSRYSKYIIQERALPDARDGLKPVQRRILYAMNEEGNTYEKNFRKAAKTVGTVIGNYHPHGDSSVYEAMVRLSQNWKVRHNLVEMHGNNGSLDGDPPAAMRYTESKLSEIASEMLRDIDKDTVDYIPNFDDTIYEPVVLPAKFPNLLVNGSTGISAGYATDIPPHNLAEVIDAVIKKIDNPDVTVDELMEVIKGPDFPTGGIVQGANGIRNAYETGKGKIIVRGNTVIEDIKGGREQIVIDEVPFDINKMSMVKRIEELRIDRKVDGIAEVRDETDRTGLRVVIELKKGSNSEDILKYLYKNTDLQVTYNFNMVAIYNKTPKLLSLPQILDAYIDHQKEIITRQASFELEQAKNRAHIVDGLIKAVSILDEVISTIRSSADKQDAKKHIANTYNFTEKQAEAIVTLQLYRLTNTDITKLEEEAKNLSQKIHELESLLNSETQVLDSIKRDLNEIKQSFAEERQTVIQHDIEDLTYNIEVTVAKEDVVLTLTRDGYIKQTSIRSYSASNGENPGLKEGDFLQDTIELNTTDHILLFTNLGRYIYLPIHTLPDIRWKDVGQHISNFASIDKGERIIQCIPVRTFASDQYFIFFTKHGMVKRSQMNLYQPRIYSKALIALNLKQKDEVVAVQSTSGDDNVFVASDKGYGLWYHESSISVVGQRASGVKAMELKENETLINGQVFAGHTDPSIIAITNRGAAKRMALHDFTKTERGNRGHMMLRKLKAKNHQLIKIYIVNEDITLYCRTADNKVYTIRALDLNISELNSNGSFFIDRHNDGEITEVWKEPSYHKPFVQHTEQ